MPSKISARNQLKGKVTRITKGDVLTSVEVEISGPAKVFSVITSNSASDLNLKVGDNVEAVVKSTEVMIAKD